MPSNKMLIDASHPEETRVVVLRGNKVEEFDFESSSRRPLKGNIYLAKVTRVEPSLQAAFIEYGGNRHGFLAFSEIHPDYYQIPYADRQALLAEDEEEDEEDQASAEAEAADPQDAGGEDAAADGQGEAATPAAAFEAAEDRVRSDVMDSREDEGGQAVEGDRPTSEATLVGEDGGRLVAPDAPPRVGDRTDNGAEDRAPGPETIDEPEEVESVGAEDALEEVPRRRVRQRQRQYKIQEVIKRRQVLLVQVVKEERGTKGAALTTYLSLAGRYCVLMPNTGRGGGISRKITNATDRKRLKDIATELKVPDGMGVILRTAGANRTKPEIKRDFEYLLRLWESIRDLTLRSSAPSLIYEEGSLIKRSIRDLYSPDISEIHVAGDEAFAEARDFMGMLMPGHEEHVRAYRDPVPMFARHRVEGQLDQMFSPHAPLPSGGYIVLNQAEALVAIDVNSGRSTREHSIEDTALQTNLEAADEIARQIRLRDLAGLIVIDFIDMEEKRNNRAVERQLKDSLRADRARIQVGRISHFGLLEMSRQRLRTGVLESSSEPCPHCGGTGQVRSVASLSLQILRAVEDQLMRNAGHHLRVATRPDAALYMLNQKRAHLHDLEERFGASITVHAETPETGHTFAIERGEAVAVPVRERRAVALLDVVDVPPLEEEDEAVEAVAETVSADGETARNGGGEEDERAGRRRRRRRRGRDEGDREQATNEERPSAVDAPGAVAGEAADMVAGAASADGEEAAEAVSADGETPRSGGGDEDERGGRRRRRGRRGGRRRGGEREEAEAIAGDEDGSPSDAEAAAEGETDGTIGAAGVAEPMMAGNGNGAADDPDRGERDAPLEPPATEVRAANSRMVEPRVVESRDKESRADLSTYDPTIAGPPEDAEPAAGDAEVVDALASLSDEGRPDHRDGDERVADQRGAATPDRIDPPERPAPATAVPPPAPAEEEEGRPKRTGWWTRRSFF